MPITVIDDPFKSLSTSLGSSIGQGINEGLTDIVSNRLRVAQQQKQRDQLKDSLQALGYTPADADRLSGLPQDILSQVIKQKVQEPSQRAYADALRAILGNEQQQQGEGESSQSLPDFSQLTGQQAKDITQLALQKRQNEEKNLATAFKETKEDRSSITNSYKAAIDQEGPLNRLEQLSQKDKLPNPTFYTLMSKAGLNIKGLTSGDAQEFEKISTNFLRFAKNIFGSRLTNYDVQSFLRTVPTLENTKEGKLRIINQMRLINEAAKIRYKAMRAIMKDNNGKPPFDLSERIEDRVGEEIDQLAKRFTSGNTFSSLPSAEQYKGKKIRDTETGEVLVSDGTQWRKA